MYRDFLGPADTNSFAKFEKDKGKNENSIINFL